jgi:NADPH:quinone reductase-like Zn-dependent oxidoreductase
MKAAYYDRYGPPEVVTIREIGVPPLLDADHILVKVHSACVNPYDIFFRKGYYPIRLSNGLFKPKQTFSGGDMAGTVEAVGPGVNLFMPGDRVYGGGGGTHAEFARSRQKFLARMPENASFNEAAALPTVALTALGALRDQAEVKEGQRVLVYGASGGIGHIAVQLARHYGAEVTAVTSTANLDWVKDLGAHTVLDYKKEDFAQNGQKYDLIYDTVGKLTFFSTRDSLTENGLYITEHILYPKYHGFQMLFGRLTGDRRMKIHLAQTNRPDLEFIAELVEAGALKPVIDRIYPLAQIGAAHRHVENGHTKGKVVVEVQKD